MAFTKCWLAYPAIPGAACEKLTVCVPAGDDPSWPAPGRSSPPASRACTARSWPTPPARRTSAWRSTRRSTPKATASPRAKAAAALRAAVPTGVLYGVFALLRALQMNGCALKDLTLRQQAAPANVHRMLNHWDNMDGSIERGYSGDSFFFKDDVVLVDEDRLNAYGRMLASVGINGIVINNVNVKQAASWLITDRYFAPLRRYQEILGAYGVKLYLSINFAAPIELGGMDTLRPLRPGCCRLVEGKGRRCVGQPARSGRLPRQGRQRRPPRPLHLQPHPGRRRQHAGRRRGAVRRPHRMALLRLQLPSRTGATPRSTAPARATTPSCRWTASSATTSRCRSRTAPWTSRCASRSRR